MTDAAELADDGRPASPLATDGPFGGLPNGLAARP
jgi:hypothetical protein